MRIIEILEGDAPPVWYSGLTRAVAQIPQNVAPGLQWAGAIQNLIQKGVRQAEIDYSGIVSWLQQQPGPLTKDQVLAQLQQAEVQVHDVMKDEELPNSGRATRRTTSYSQYRLPGGQDYRELLLTTPPKQHELQVGEPEAPRTLRQDGGQHVENTQDIPFDIGGQKGRITYWPQSFNYRGEETGPEWVVNSTFLQNGHFKSLEDAKAAINTRINQDYKNGYLAGRPDIYRSRHWGGVTNPLAHIRFDTRMDAQGNQTLHVAEIQSDWHQEGRKRGYQTEPTKPTNAEQREGYWEVTDQNGEFVTNVYASVAATAEDAIREAERRLAEQPYRTGQPKVPDAPFRKEWPMLAVKRILRYAADNGFDRVTWDAGKTHAKRYDLSQTISQIVYLPKKSLLYAYDKRGKEVITDQHVPPEQLADYIGKDAAERLLAQPDEPLTGPNGSWTSNSVMVKRLAGEKLKVGESGMVGFYDEMLPRMVSKYVRRWGGQVGQTRVNAAREGKRTAYSPAWELIMTPELKQAVSAGQSLWESDSSQG